MKMYKWISVAVLLMLTMQLFAKVYPDSVQQASKEQYRIRQGLNIDISGGGGVGRYAFKQFNAQSDHVSNAIALPTWNAALGINYYFLDWLGVGTGVQYSTYANTSNINKPWTEHVDDDGYGDPYDLTATPKGIVEKQSLSMVEVPLALRFRVIEANVGLHAAAGLKFGVPIKDSYSMSATGATIHNTVDYKTLSWTIDENIPGVIEDAAITPIEGKDVGLKRLNYGAYAELGMLFRLHQRLDLMLALAATYYVNDVRDGKSTTPLGFSESVKASSYHLPYADAAYAGVLRTNEVESLHPWNVVLKLGLSINTGRTTAQHAYDNPAWGEREAQREAKRQARKPKCPLQEQAEPVEEPAPVVEPEPEPAPEPEPEPEPAPEPDPVVQPEPVVEEPVMLAQATNVPEGLNKNRRVEIVPVDANLFPTQVIWFNLNEVNPKIEPADMLEQVAKILARHPEQKVQVNGHACVIGKPAYNQKLALRRANVVAQQLRDLGVRDEQIIVQSFGSDVPFGAKR